MHAGTGKTTALVNVADTLIPYLDDVRAHDQVAWTKYIQRGGEQLSIRLDSWATAHGPLVFHVDFSAEHGKFVCL